jgi:hypothetical protein
MAGMPATRYLWLRAVCAVAEGAEVRSASELSSTSTVSMSTPMSAAAVAAVSAVFSDREYRVAAIGGNKEKPRCVVGAHTCTPYAFLIARFLTHPSFNTRTPLATAIETHRLRMEICGWHAALTRDGSRLVLAQDVVDYQKPCKLLRVFAGAACVKELALKYMTWGLAMCPVTSRLFMGVQERGITVWSLDLEDLRCDFGNDLAGERGRFDLFSCDAETLAAVSTRSWRRFPDASRRLEEGYYCTVAFFCSMTHALKHVYFRREYIEAAALCDDGSALAFAEYNAANVTVIAAVDGSVLRRLGIGAPLQRAMSLACTWAGELVVNIDLRIGFTSSMIYIYPCGARDAEPARVKIYSDVYVHHVAVHGDALVVLTNDACTLVL